MIISYSARLWNVMSIDGEGDETNSEEFNVAWDELREVLKEKVEYFKSDNKKKRTII